VSELCNLERISVLSLILSVRKDSVFEDKPEKKSRGSAA